MSLAILVPVLRRPQRVPLLLNSIEASTPDAEVVFIADPHDAHERRAIRKAQERYPMPIVTLVKAGGYAKKINEAVRATDRPLLFIGADDLEFRPGWLEAARARLSSTVQVVGVNDLIRRRREHTTHFLMTREYAQLSCLDGSRGPVCERYDHSFTDDELIATAKHRGAYAYAADAVVKHLHPFGGNGTDDEVYEKGRRLFRQDRRKFEARRPLWI